MSSGIFFTEVFTAKNMENAGKRRAPVKLHDPCISVVNLIFE
jgi:hypothetical protein